MKFLIFFFLLASVHVFGEPLSWNIHETEFSIGIEISSSEIRSDQQLQVNLQLTYPSDYKIKENEILSHLLWHVNPLKPHWELVKQAIETSSNKINTFTKFSFLLSPIGKEISNLSFFKIQFYPISSKQKIQGFLTPIFDIKIVKPDLAMNEKMKLTLLPMQPQYPVDLSIENREWLESPSRIISEALRSERLVREHAFPWIAFLILMISPLLWLLWKNFGPFDLLKKAVQPTIEPDKQALNALEALKQKNLTSKGNYREYYFELTEIVRQYLEQTFNIPATSRTTEELSYAYLSQIYAQDLLRLFQRADKIKFAQGASTMEESNQALEDVKNMINTSKPISKQ